MIINDKSINNDEDFFFFLSSTYITHVTKKRERESQSFITYDIY